MSVGTYSKAAKPKPVFLQVRLAFRDLSDFATGYASHISDRGIFVRSRDPRPVGSRLSFELKLSSGEVAFAGKGLVRWVQGLDAQGLGTPGMGLEFEHLSEESRRVIELVAVERARNGQELVAGANPSLWRPLSEFPPIVEELPEELEPPAPPPMMTPSPGFLKPELPEITAPLPQANARIAQAPVPPMMVPALPVTPELPETTAPIGQRDARPAEALPSTVPTETLRTVKPALAPQTRTALGLQLEGSLLRLVNDVSTWAIPAAAAVTGSGELVFGRAAADALAAGAQGTRGLGSLLGLRQETEAARAWERRHFVKVVAGDDPRPAVQLGGRLVSATTLCEGIIAEAVREAYDGTGTEPGHVVVALATGLTQPKKRALEEVILGCGLEIASMAPAPALSVLSKYGDEGRRRVLVVALGEESLEVAIVEQKNRALNVVATHSTDEVGAIDLDLLLVEALLTQFEKDVDVTMPEDLGAFERVRHAASCARVALSDVLEHEVYLPNLIETGLSRADLQQKLTRARLQALGTPLVDRILQIVRSVLTMRELGPGEVDDVLLVGHNARLPSLGLRLKELFGREPVRPSEDSFEVARGAMMVAEAQAGASAFTVGQTVGTPLWIVPVAGAPKRLLDRGLSLPAERTYVAVADEGATELELGLLQGEKGDTGEDLVGTLLIGPIPTPPHGERARATLIVSVDQAGDVNVTAKSMNGDEVPTMLDRSRLPTPR